MKPPAGAESSAVQSSVPETQQAAPVAQSAPEAVTPKAPAAPSLDPDKIQMARDLATLRQTVEQLAAGQDQMTREIGKLESAVVELTLKIPEPPPQPPAAPTRKPMRVPSPSSRAPIPPPHR